MLANQRKEIINQQLKMQNSVTVAELVKLLNVSTETVRRDLEDMENRHLLVRVHGGAIPVKRMSHLDSIEVRTVSNIQLKEQIARKALDYVHDGDVIAIDSGSTASVFAEALKERCYDSLSVITYSSEVFSILSDCPNYDLA